MVNAGAFAYDGSPHRAKIEPAAEGNAVISPDAISPDILGIEIGSSAVRAVLVNRESREIVGAAECGVFSTGGGQVGGGVDPRSIGPAVDDVLYQLGVDDRSQVVVAVTIGPDYSGVGSGPALPAWLDHQARQLGENLVCAGDLGVAFCPQRPIDSVIAICEEAELTVARIDLAPVAAARLLAPGSADTVTIGSGHGWRARLRDDEVLEALQNTEIDADQPMAIIAPDGLEIPIDAYHGVTVASALAESYDLNLAQLAPAVGAATGYIDSAPASLLDGKTITGQEAVVTAVGSAAVYGSAEAGRTTVDLHRASARTAIGAGSERGSGFGRNVEYSTFDDVGGGDEPGGLDDVAGFAGVDDVGATSDVDVDLTRFDDRAEEDELNVGGSPGLHVPDRDTGPMLIERSFGRRFGRSRSEAGPEKPESEADLIAKFSPDPDSEKKLIDDSRRFPVPLLILLAVVIVALIIIFVVL